jgi:pyruvate carboxylase
MVAAIEDTKTHGGIVEACICYTGDLSSPKEQKYTLSYYLDLAKKLEQTGSDILCIKDMAGLLKPLAARQLIRALKDHIGMPIHLHTHDTSGNGVAMLLAASDAGCDIVDTALSSMSGLTSQPSMNALCAALENTERQSSLSLRNLDELSSYWAGVRQLYQAFDPGMIATTTRVYEHEIPGGQYSNLVEQARKVGLNPKEFEQLTERYKEVNELLGNIVKVTPSSKVVGDFALLLQKNQLTGPEFLKNKPKLDYPDSVLSFFKGHIGIPYGGFPSELRELVLGKSPPPPQFEAVDLEDSLVMARQRLVSQLNRDVSDEEVLSYRLYPKVYMEFNQRQEQFGHIHALTTPAFFYGIRSNQEIAVDVEPGKTLYISLSGISDPDPHGYRTVFFNLNGFARDVRILDQSLAAVKNQRAKAEKGNLMHIGAPMPGKVLSVRVKEGDSVALNQVLLVTESMKMEYAVMAKQSGTVGAIHIHVGDMIDDNDLLLELRE